jgi:hypothetical protein
MITSALAVVSWWGPLVVVGWWGPLVVVRWWRWLMVVGWWCSAGGGRLVGVGWCARLVRSAGALGWCARLVRSAGPLGWCARLVGGFKILAAFAAPRRFARVRAGFARGSRGSHGARRFAACSARARLARGRCV